MTGLTLGKTYMCSVTATNKRGAGPTATSNRIDRLARRYDTTPCNGRRGALLAAAPAQFMHRSSSP